MLFFYSIFSASNDKNTSTSNMLNPKIFSIELQRSVINNSSLWLDCKYIYIYIYFNPANDSFSHFCFSLLSQFSLLCNYGPSWVGLMVKVVGPMTMGFVFGLWVVV